MFWRGEDLYSSKMAWCCGPPMFIKRLLLALTVSGILMSTGVNPDSNTTTTTPSPSTRTFGLTTADTVEHCCTLGRGWFNASRERCGRYREPVTDVSEHHQTLCLSTIQVCCLEETRTKQCLRGKQNAKIRGSCTELQSVHGNHRTRECCHCCQLGLYARNSGLSCRSLQLFGAQCDDIIQECCLSGGQGDVWRATTTQQPQLQTTAPGICARYPGQLCAHICEDTLGSYRCRCFEGFSLHADGRTCRQSDLGNRCAQGNPCQHLCRDTGSSILCSCFNGYALQGDGTSCMDINECIVGSDNCTRSQRCVNSPGSYACEGSSSSSDTQSNPADSCTVGFTSNPRTGRCEDVDECRLNRHSCSYNQRCVNTEGAFLCTDIQRNPSSGVTVDCGVGYTWNTHSNRCEDLNECALNHDSCLNGQNCENTIGSYVCRRSMSCGTGYTLQKDAQTCIDDDECALGTHNCGAAWVCRNLEGSFRCTPKECPLGYKLEPQSGRCTEVVCPRGLTPGMGGSCIDKNECLEMERPCSANQECHNTIGSFVCRSLLMCTAGYKLNTLGTRCSDVDECADGTHECRGHRQICINRPGSYICQCPEGYSIDHVTRHCEDIDECVRHGGQMCSQNADCINTEGSFHCTCKPGYESKDDGRVCQDILECEQVGMCHHTCVNTWGSYQCTCRLGYELADDQRTCRDIDECAVWAGRGGSLCIGLCSNTDGSYECSCPEGYRMMVDGRTCQDIDECALGTASCSGSDDFCINTRGGYKCETATCPQGFRPAPGINARSNSGTGTTTDGSHVQQGRNRVGSLLPRPPLVSFTEGQGLMCHKAMCTLMDIDCILNRTQSIQFYHLAIPSVHLHSGPIPLLKIYTLGESIYPNLFFSIASGNEGGWFDFTRNQTDSGNVTWQLIHSIEGPATHVLKLQIDSCNMYGQTVSTHIAVVKIFVSKYYF